MKNKIDIQIVLKINGKEIKLSNEDYIELKRQMESIGMREYVPFYPNNHIPSFTTASGTDFDTKTG